LTHIPHVIDRLVVVY